jgi:holo-[acyl-carrier protein] synthase
MATGSSESDTGARLRKAVAEFFEVDEGEVGSAFSLQGRSGQGSLARAALDSVIRRRVGLTSRSVYSARTYGELEAELVPGAPATPPGVNGQGAAPAPAAVADAPVAGAVRCGIDIETIDHLPRAADCWEDPFYQDHFAPSEIAHCLLQEAPALHFAARWCVKEALKKCDNAFLATAMKDIEVVVDDAGAPSLVHHAGGKARRLPHAVSLSHTPHSAVAVVVKVEPPPAVVVPAVTTPPADPPPPPPRRRGGTVPTLLSLAALVAAIVALVRTYLVVK